MKAELTFIKNFLLAKKVFILSTNVNQLKVHFENIDIEVSILYKIFTNIIDQVIFIVKATHSLKERQRILSYTFYLYKIRARGLMRRIIAFRSICGTYFYIAMFMYNIYNRIIYRSTLFPVHYPI